MGGEEGRSRYKAKGRKYLKVAKGRKYLAGGPKNLRRRWTLEEEVRRELDVQRRSAPKKSQRVVDMAETGPKTVRVKEITADGRPSVRRGQTGSGRKRKSEILIAHSVVKDAAPGELEEHWAAVRRMLALAGYELLVEGVERQGSVFRDWAIRRGKKNARKMVEAAAIAFNDGLIRKPGADATLTLAQAIQTVLASAGEHECVHVFDNLVIGQRRGSDGTLKQFSKELTVSERKVIGDNPQLVDEPSTFLRDLAVAVAALEGGAVSVPVMEKQG